MARLGIDIGTSNTLVASVNSAGEPEVREIDGHPMVPSVIYIEEEGGNVTVGNAARDMWADPGYDADRCFRRWKLRMGEGDVLRSLRFGGARSDAVAVTPELLTTRLVEYVVGELCRGAGGETLESALVTVPHGWRRERPEKCQATRTAAAEARLNGAAVRVQPVTVSEPVAAAAYWLWAARKRHAPETLEGRTFLVCDVGGGTFDLSLVVVGGPDRPLDVVDAVNSDLAGDYVDALLTAHVCREFNARFGTSYPTDAEGVIAALGGTDTAWLRKWFLDVQQKVKERMSVRLENSRAGRDGVKPIRETFSDAADNHLKVDFELATFEACLEPFYRSGRDLLRTFLGRLSKDRLPFAVAFAGGGSRISGIREHVVMPVLREFYPEPEVGAVLERIPVNPGKLDQAIALGAALIANGIVSVKERLLHNVGIQGSIPATIANKLGIPGEKPTILLTPLLSRGAELPASFSSGDTGLLTAMEPGEQLSLEVVVDDDAQDPWIQSWEIPHPGGGRRQSVEWLMEADTDGVLTLRLKPQRGQSTSIAGRIERRRTGRASLVFGPDSGMARGTLPRVSPAALREAIEALRRA